MILVVFSVFLMCQSNKIIYYLLINNSQNHHFNTSSARFLKIVNFTGTTYSPFYYLCYRPKNGLAGNLPIVCFFIYKKDRTLSNSVLHIIKSFLIEIMEERPLSFLKILLALVPHMQPHLQYHMS